MITSLIAFFSGSFFRVIWGEISAYITTKQDHKFELERLEFQAREAAAQHARNLEAIKVQADKGIETIRVQGEADLGRLEQAGFNAVVELTGKSTGIRFVDAWNAVIRPGGATVSLFLVVCSEFTWIVMSDNGWLLASAFLGVFVADRQLFKRGK